MPKPSANPPAGRLRAFMDERELTQEAASELFDCSAAFVSMILRGTKLPGRRVANNIEAQTATWGPGPIRSVEWDAVEEARRAPELDATGS